MISKVFGIGAIAVSILSMVAPGSCTPTDDRSAIQVALDLSNKGMVDKNAAEAESDAAPDSTSKDMNGKVHTFQEMQQIAPLLFQHMTFISAKDTILTFSIKDGKAYVTTKGHVVVQLLDPRTQKLVTVVRDDTSSKIWRKIGGKWKEEYSETTSDHMQRQTSPASAPGTGA
jgi:hypothetical protein